MNGRSCEDDSWLVESCIKKDHAAWELLIRKYSPLVEISIKTRLDRYGFRPSAEEVEDIRQTAITAIWNGGKLEGIKNRRNISYWLAIVSGNIALEYMRKRHRDKPGLFIGIDDIDEDDVPRTGPGPGGDAAGSELSTRINDAIDSLPDTEKLIVKLNMLHGKKYGDIARILSIPRGTVASHLRRGKERLRRKLKDFADE